VALAVRRLLEQVSYDERIVRFGKRHGRQFGFAVAA
jgi:hypothetical protein